MFGIIKVPFLTSDFFTQFIKNWLKILICPGKKLTEDFNMFWKTRIFDDSLTANGNKLRTYRNLKEKYETDTYLFLNIDKTLIKQFTQIKISNSKLMIECGCFESFPFRQYFVIFVRQITWFRWICIELPMSMYTAKTPIDLCRFNVRSST
jgi:hypothetical protein